MITEIVNVVGSAHLCPISLEFPQSNQQKGCYLLCSMFVGDKGESNMTHGFAGDKYTGYASQSRSLVRALK